MKTYGLAGWVISLAIHVGVVVIFLVVSFPDSQEARPVKQPPQAMIEPIAEPLQVEPLRDRPDLDMPILEEPKPLNSDSVPIPYELIVPASSAGVITVSAPDGYASIATGKGGYAAVGAGRSSFCGSSGMAERICFVVDCSGSMVIAFDYIRGELKRSISSLSPAQYFHLIFFAGDEPIELSGRNLVRAGAANRRVALSFIDQVGLTSVGSAVAAWHGVVKALERAFEVKSFNGGQVQLIYLLTDGQYDRKEVAGAVNRLQARRKTPAVINVIACGNRDNEDFLRNLALTCEGQYRFVSDEELAAIHSEYNETYK